MGSFAVSTRRLNQRSRRFGSLGVLAGHGVGVGVEGEGDAVVAEAVGDDFGVDSSGE